MCTKKGFNIPIRVAGHICAESNVSPFSCGATFHSTHANVSNMQINPISDGGTILRTDILHMGQQSRVAFQCHVPLSTQKGIIPIFAGHICAESRVSFPLQCYVPLSTQAGLCQYLRGINVRRVESRSHFSVTCSRFHSRSQSRFLL